MSDAHTNTRTLRGKVAVAGIGETTYYKHGKSPDPEFKLALMAILRACEDAGLGPREIDGFASYSNDRNEPSRLAAALGLPELRFSNMQWGGGGGGGAAAVGNAAAAVAAGLADCVVVFRALAQGQFARFGQGAPVATVSGEPAFTFPYGLISPAQRFAMRVMRFMHDHGVRQEALRAIALASYRHAQANPRAVMHGRPLTPEMYDASRWIVEPFRLFDCCLENEDLVRSKAGADPRERLRDQQRDGVDAEVVFPNKGLSMWATLDPPFAMAQCRVWNDWAWETFGPYVERMSPAAALATADLDGSIAEVRRVAAMGFRVLTLPCKPVWGGHDVEHPNYNLPLFDPLWAVIQDADLAITFHVSTGRDPRAARGNGGAVINYVSHSLSPTIEPVANLCASGMLQRFPRLRFATIEAGIGWLPWLLTAMDEAYLKHHFWVRPKLAKLPSEYFRLHGFASFGEDRPGLDLAEPCALVDNLMWANDYPHHEGSWPHSAEAIERTMGHLSDPARAKILGLNAAKLFRFRVPEGYAA